MSTAAKIMKVSSNKKKTQTQSRFTFSSTHMKNAHKTSFFSIKWSRKTENSCVQLAIMSTMCETQKNECNSSGSTPHLWLVQRYKHCRLLYHMLRRHLAYAKPVTLGLDGTESSPLLWWLTMSNLHRKRKMENSAMSSGVKSR